MNTDSFAAFLAKGAGPAPRHVIARRLGPAVCAGFIVSVALALLVIGPLPLQVFETWTPWIKVLYVVSLLASALLLTSRLARPLSRPGWPILGAVAVFVFMLIAGGLGLLNVPDEQRLAALFGQTWMICPWMVLGLSIPALGGLLWALRGLAPTRLKLASAGAGFLAGSVGALGYSFVCPESSVMFIAIWYTLGIVLTTGLGALIGPRFIRW